MVERDPEHVTASITFMGGDRQGVVARVTQALFRSGANIESLEEQVSRGFFSMSILASWARDDMTEGPQAELTTELRSIGDEVGMEARVRFHAPGARQRMAILVTKEAHCLEALLEASEAGDLGAKPVVVIGNRPDLRAMAEVADVPFEHVPWHPREDAEDRLIEVLERHDVDFLVLARFMRILSPDLCWRYRNRIINIHPSLLPAFPGAMAYRQAWEKGVRIVGVTAHFVTPDLDQGPIIHQDAFRVGPDETVDDIKRQGREREAEVLVDAVRLFLKKRLDVHWGRVWNA